MTTFVNAIQNQKTTTTTTNGMKARKRTGSACVDLFFKVGASRGKDIIPDFVAAYVEDKDLALRIAAWVRDVRGGAGERQIYRDILKHLDRHDPAAAFALASKAPELGRWDDVLAIGDAWNKNQENVFNMIKDALASNDGLCAKWMPRKGDAAVALRNHLGWTPKFYRKRLVELTKVVETQMCAKQWDDINFSHVPSVASSRYKKAFYRNAPAKYQEYIDKLVKGDDPTVKVNAGAIFPHDVLKGRIRHYIEFSGTELKLIEKQWEALPNYVGDAKILPLVDVSGSMNTPSGKSGTTCMEIAVSLGLYLADKNVGKFKDAFLTFSGNPELLYLKGNINQKIEQMVSSNWGMNTDLEAAFKLILKTATKGKVPQEEMPEVLLILSDMQFDACCRPDYTAFKMIRKQYEAAGYNLPKIVFWNLNAHDNVPVKFDKEGTALVSGFSPAIMKSVLAADLEQFTPESSCLKLFCKIDTK